jgi:hypothetical protein
VPIKLIVRHRENGMMRSAVLDLKTFVSAKDHALVKQFYVDLGFKVNWDNPQVAELEIDLFRYLLQNYCVKEYAGNFMMHLMVEDAEAWWKYIEAAGLIDMYPGITAKPPTVQPWGLRVRYLTDPTDVLWHIADNRTELGHATATLE